MQDLAKTTDYKVQRLSQLLEMENGETYFASIAETFKSSNRDVEDFLKKKSHTSNKIEDSYYISCMYAMF